MRRGATGVSLLHDAPGGSTHGFRDRGPRRSFFTGAVRARPIPLWGDGAFGHVEAGDDAMSARVNDAVRCELERRRRQRLLTELLDELDTVHGPPNEKLLRKM